MATYKELVEKRDLLNAQIEVARTLEVGAAIDQIRSLMTQYGLVPDDIVAKQRGRKTGKETSAVSRQSPPLYRDPKTGKTWSGRGRVPLWLGKNRERFRIPD